MLINTCNMCKILSVALSPARHKSCVFQCSLLVFCHHFILLPEKEGNKWTYY